MTEKEKQPIAENLKYWILVENKATNNWAPDLAGGDFALQVKTDEIVHSLRFWTVAETIWLKSVKKPVKIRLVWGKNDQQFTTGDAWESFVLGKPPSGTQWIVTMTFGDEAEFYLYPYNVAEPVETEKK